MGERNPYSDEIKELKWDFAAVLRRLREERFDKQSDFAKHAKLSPKTVSNLECGDSEPWLSTVLILIQALDVSPDELLKGLEPPATRKPPTHHK